MFKKDKNSKKEVKKSIHSENELIKCQKIAADNLAGWKRARADYKNLEKRFADEKKELGTLLRTETIYDLLPIIDNFENALKNIPKDLEDNAWISGIKFIYQQFDQFLVANDVKKIKCLDESFDPTLHEAVEKVSIKNKPEDTITEVVLTGYKVGDKVIRPAKVKVNIKNN